MPSSSINSTACASSGYPAWVASSTIRSITPSSISTATGVIARAVISATVLPACSLES